MLKEFREKSMESSRELEIEEREHNRIFHQHNEEKINN